MYELSPGLSYTHGSHLQGKARTRYRNDMRDEREPEGFGGYAASPPSASQPDLAEVLAPAPAGLPGRFRQSLSSWAAAPATYTLLGINCGVFLLMVLSGISPLSPQPDQLLHWGADLGALILVYGEWWRLLTAMFLHVGFLHLATNMWCLWNLGLLGEPLLGGPGLVAAYLLTGFAGNLLSVATHPGLSNGGADGVVGAGASGAIFGLAGLLIVLLNSPYLPLPVEEKKRLRKSVIWFAALNFVLAFGVDAGHFSLKIDNSAHLGGFLAGLLLALPMVPKIGAPQTLFRRRRFLAIAGELLLLLLLCAGVRAFYLGAAQGS